MALSHCHKKLQSVRSSLLLASPLAPHQSAAHSVCSTAATEDIYFRSLTDDVNMYPIPFFLPAAMLSFILLFGASSRVSLLIYVRTLFKVSSFVLQ